MCLVTRQTVASVSKTDKVCYKLVARCGVGYQTPYRNSYIDDDTIKGKKLFQAYGYEDIVHDMDYLRIHGGFVHTFIDRTLAMDMARNYGYSCFECVIPAGVPFYESGSFGESCSKSIKFVKQIY